MRIVVTHHEIVDGIDYAHFDTSAGSGFGQWHNDEAPDLQREYDVEFNFDPIVGAEGVAIPAQHKTYQIEYVGGAVRLTGQVSSDEVGGHFRLGEDCIILIDVLPAQTFDREWMTLRCRPSQFSIWPFGA